MVFNRKLVARWFQRVEGKDEQVLARAVETLTRAVAEQEHTQNVVFSSVAFALEGDRMLVAVAVDWQADMPQIDTGRMVIQ